MTPFFQTDATVMLRRAEASGSLEDAARAVIYAHYRPGQDGETLLLGLSIQALERALETALGRRK